MPKNYIKIENQIELQQFKESIGKDELFRLLTLVQNIYDEIIKYIKQGNEEYSLEGMCLETSRYINNKLRINGFETKVLQGEIEISNNAWLEHHISLIFLNKSWVTIDFTAGQIKSLSGVNFLILVCDPNKESLGTAIRGTYNWWTND